MTISPMSLSVDTMRRKSARLTRSSTLGSPARALTSTWRALKRSSSPANWHWRRIAKTCGWSSASTSKISIEPSSTTKKSTLRSPRENTGAPAAKRSSLP